ncbi:MAG: serine hydrolase [Patescibacteria group bacterium]
MIETFGIFIALALSFFPARSPSNAEVAPAHTIQQEPHIIIDDSYTAHSVLLFNFDDDNKIAQRASDTALPIASITKIMTGYIALKNLSPESQIRMSKESIETEGTIGKFRSDEIFSLPGILEAMMTASSNDAAMALAEHIGRERGGKDFDESIQIFVTLMNETAHDLGMSHTTYINPTGLDTVEKNPSNYSTADDLAILLKTTSIETPLLWDLSRDSNTTILSDRGVPHDFFNLNILAPHIMHFIGGKTGSTDTARESVVEIFEAPLGFRRGLIVLGADPGGKRFEEATLIINQITSVLP